MKLYDVPRNTKVKIGDVVLDFKHVDGMYSKCYTEDGKLVHPAAWTEVEIVKETENEVS